MRDLLLRHGPLVNLLVQEGPATRTHLAERLGVTKPTITRWTSELLQGGIVEERGKRPGPGRPSTVLGLAEDAAFAAALHVSRSYVEAALVSLTGRVIGKTQSSINSLAAREQVLADASEDLLQMMVEHNLPLDKCLGLGVATSGQVNQDTGTEQHWHYLEEQLVTSEVPLRQSLADKFPLPITIETNAWAVAIAERWFGHRGGNFFLLYIDNGVGAATVVNGELHRGRGLAGEIEHTSVVEAAGRKCRCGKEGCLTTLVSRKSIIEWFSQGHEGSSYNDFISAAKAGDGEVVQYLHRAADAIGGLCGPIADLLDPDAMVFAGAIFEVPGITERISKFLKENSWVGRLKGLTVLPSSFGANAGVMGAASLVLGPTFGSAPKAGADREMAKENDALKRLLGEKELELSTLRGLVQEQSSK